MKRVPSRAIWLVGVLLILTTVIFLHWLDRDRQNLQENPLNMRCDICMPSRLAKVFGDLGRADAHPAPTNPWQLHFTTPSPLLDHGNPLIDDKAVARLSNNGRTAIFYCMLPPSPFSPNRSWKTGLVRTALCDELGVPTSFVEPGTLSVFPETVVDHAGTFRQLETKTLLPGESVEEPFALLGMITGGGPKPGVYTVRAVFEYLSAPDGEVKSVTSAPISVEITADHIARWQRWLASGGQ